MLTLEPLATAGPRPETVLKVEESGRCVLPGAPRSSRATGVPKETAWPCRLEGSRVQAVWPSLGVLWLLCQGCNNT